MIQTNIRMPELHRQGHRAAGRRLLPQAAPVFRRFAASSRALPC